MKKKANPTQPVVKKLATQNVKVRATRLGYYDHKRRRVGDVFLMAVPLVDGEPELPSWCEAVNAPLKETGAQEALNAEAAATRLSSQPGAIAAPTAGDDLGI